MPEPTLEALLDRYRRERDDAAAAELVRRTRRRLLRVASRIVPADRAEDCLQLAYFSLMRERDGEFVPRVLPWLITATVRIAYAAKARESHQQSLARQLQRAPAAGDPPVRALESAETAREVRRRVSELPASYRDAVILHHLEGLSVREVAGLLGLSEEATKKRIQRGRSLLRTRLDPRLMAPALAPAWLLADAQAGLARTGGILVKKNVVLVAAVVLMALVTIVSIKLLGTDDDGPNSPARHTARQPHLALDVPRDGHEGETGQQASIHRGRVVDEDGIPISGARVRIAQGAPQGTVVAHTDGDGAFRFEHAEPQSIVIEAQGFMASEPTPSAPHPLRASPDICLERGSDLVGRVTDIKGKPVAGATVRWHGVHRDRNVQREAVSDADGTYAFAGLPRISEYWHSWLEAHGAGYAVTEIHSLPLAHAREKAVDLVLTRGATYEGIVIDARTGEPLAGAVVTVELSQRTKDTRGFLSESRSEARTLARGVSGPDGRYVILRAPARGFGDVATNAAGKGRTYAALVVRTEGYRTGSVSLEAPESGERATRNFKLWSMAHVVGRVVDGGGVPVADAHIQRADPLQGGKLGSGVRSDALGRFVYPLSAERDKTRPYTIAVSAAEWVHSDAKSEHDVEVTFGREVDLGDVVLDLQARPLVRLRVRNEDGAPVPWARVSMSQDRYLNASRGVFTDASGDAVFEGSAGVGKPVHVYIEAQGYAAAAVGPLDPFKAKDPIEVVLVKGHTLRGRVRWRDGAPAQAVFVYVVSAAMRLNDALGNAHEDQPASKGKPVQVLLGVAATDGEGRFSVNDLPAGLCHVSATAPVETPQGRRTYGASALSVATTTTDVELRLPLDAGFVEGALSGTVKDAATGDGVPGAVVRMRSEGRLVTARRLGPARFEFSPASAGTWTLEVRAPGFYPFEQKDFVVDDKSAQRPLHLTLSRRVTIDGRLRGIPNMDGFKVRFVNAAGRMSEQVRIGQDGRFSTSDLGPGHWLPLIGKGPWSVYLPRDGGRFRIAEGVPKLTIDWELTEACAVTFMRDDETPRDAPISIRIADMEGKLIYEVSNGPLLRSIPLLPGNYRVDWSDEFGKGSTTLMCKAGSGLLLTLR